MDPKLSPYKIFDSEIQTLNSLYINPSDDIISEYKTSFVDFFHHFQKHLCEHDPVVKSYPKTQYTGSFPDHLQIGNMYKEFNGAILIRLPKQSFNIEMSSPGHVEITFNMPNNIAENKREIFKTWLDHDNYITPGKFRIWAEKIINKSLNNLISINSPWILHGKNDNYQFFMSKSDHSFTMHVEKVGTDIKFDVDVMLCLEFEKYWLTSFEDLDRFVCDHEWLAEPKEPINDPNQRGWRYTFPKAEKKTMANCEHMKSTIRLIKKIRDKYEMPYLTSYHIKTIFLWEIEERSDDYWQQSLGCLMVSSIAKILNRIKARDIPFYWDHRLNLVNTLKETQINDCQNKLNGIMEKIYSYCTYMQPQGIKNILLTPNENAIENQRLASLNRRLLTGSDYPGTSSNQDDSDNMEIINPNSSLLKIGAISAVAAGCFLLYRSFNKRDN